MPELLMPTPSPDYGKPDPPGLAADVAWWADASTPAAVYKDFTLTSRYVTVRDGTRLAVDVVLPADFAPGSRLPTILRQTRYFRRQALTEAGEKLAAAQGLDLPMRRLMGAGYAFVQVDARGSGASFGSREAEVSDAEVFDGYDVIDWIVAQPWSDGQVASTGVSYEGTTSELALRHAHPALKAVAPRECVFDPLLDTGAPGGIGHGWFVNVWTMLVQSKDRNEEEAFVAKYGSGPAGDLARFTRGVAPVDGERGQELLGQAVAEHAANANLLPLIEEGLELRTPRFRDGLPEGVIPPDHYAPVHHLEELRRADVPMYTWGAWFDGGLCESAILRFHAYRDHLPEMRLILGAWDHGCAQFPDPTQEHHWTAFDQTGEILRFFDHHLKGVDTGIAGEKPVHFWTMGAGWQAADTFPPSDVQETDLWLGAFGTLVGTAPVDEGADRYAVDFSATTGSASRWTQMDIWGLRKGYPDRAVEDKKLLVYDGSVLLEDVEVTGFPIVSLFVDSNEPDGAFHAYLEEVTESGEVRYVTEGMLRSIHRKLMDDPPSYRAFLPTPSMLEADALPMVPGEVGELRFHLQPVSYRFRSGSRIRLALAGADAANFVQLGDAPEWIVHRSPASPSRVTLPVRPTR